MSADPSSTVRRDIRREVALLLRQRYGRSGDARSVGRGLSVTEAGCALGRGWWGVQSALREAGTSFETEHLNFRLDVMLHDILLYPHEMADVSWAAAYGYASTDTAARALRTRYAITLADARRTATVAMWLLHARTAGPASSERLDEAERRIAAFSRAVRRPLGPRASFAVGALGRRLPPDTLQHGRPRYPRIGRDEGRRLGAAIT